MEWEDKRKRDVICADEHWGVSEEWGFYVRVWVGYEWVKQAERGGDEEREEGEVGGAEWRAVHWVLQV